MLHLALKTQHAAGSQGYPAGAPPGKRPRKASWGNNNDNNKGKGKSGGKGKDKGNSKGRDKGSGPSQASLAGEVCKRWNNGSCTEPCPHGRQHVCMKCGSPQHEDTACPNKGKGKGK